MHGRRSANTTALRSPVALAVDREWRRYWAARMVNPLADAETMKITEENRIIELGKKPSNYDDIQGQYIGLIKIRADHVTQLPKTWRAMDKNSLYDEKDFENMYMTSFIPSHSHGWEARAAFMKMDEQR